MHALHKLQQSFAADIWDEGLNRLDGVILHGQLPADRLFQVFRNNFRTATEEALAGVYPVVRRLVGDQFFSFLVDHFLRCYPPRYGNLLQFGGDLPVFLNDFKPAENLPYLSDIARLEWACHQVFHAQDSSPFNTQALAEVAPENTHQLIFELSSCSRLLYSPFPIFQIWSVNQANYDGDQSVDLASGAESVLVARPHLELKLQKLNRADARFLQNLVAGSTLGQATETAVKNSKDFDLEQVLARYLATGALIPKGTESSVSPFINNPAGGIYHDN